MSCCLPGTKSALPGRPRRAKGTFLRIITVNDVYKLDNYPSLASARAEAKSMAQKLDCVVLVTISGDFLSPSIFTALDGGRTLMQAMNAASVDYAALGNHEFDIGFQNLKEQMEAFRGTLINSNVKGEYLAGHPPHVILNVGARKVVLGGFVTNDKSIYAPAHLPDAKPINEALLSTWDSAKAAAGCTPDLFVPLTHQEVDEDRASAAVLKRHPELSSRAPVIVGGHEHEVIVDRDAPMHIVKVGSDAENVGIIDIWWTANGSVESATTLLPTTTWRPDPRVLRFVRDRYKFLETMYTTPIATLPQATSTLRVRHEPSYFVSFLLSLLKRGFGRNNVEVAMLQGGSIRGQADYQAGPITMGDLYKELAYETEMALVRLPGWVIADSIRNTRSSEKPAPGFLHCDLGVVINEALHVLEINQEPFDAERVYNVAIFEALLTGMNAIEPMLTYASEHKVIPDADSCLPAKTVIMTACIKRTWQDLVGYGAKWDLDHNGMIDNQELTAGIDRVLATIDTSKDGRIDISELRSYLEREHKNREAASSFLLERMISTLDTDKDGMVSAQELRRIAQPGFD